MPRRYSDSQLFRARHLRREMTNAETILWESLRARGIGLKFRRQVPVGPYIADFICIEAKLIVELDGAPHDDPSQILHDKQRDSWLRAQGWRILRVSNDLVIGGGNIILEEIKRAIASPAPSSDPR